MVQIFSRPEIKIVTEIKTLNDLIEIAENIDNYVNIPTNNKNRLVDLLPTLYKLKNMIGLGIGLFNILYHITLIIFGSRLCDISI